jgi:hypothetical protein
MHVLLPAQTILVVTLTSTIHDVPIQGMFGSLFPLSHDSWFAQRPLRIRYQRNPMKGTPGRPTSHAKAERANQTCLEWGRHGLMKSGLPLEWSALAIRHALMCRRCQPRENGTSIYSDRHPGCKAPEIWLFGAKVLFKPSPKPLNMQLLNHPPPANTLKSTIPPLSPPPTLKSAITLQPPPQPLNLQSLNQPPNL